MAWNDVGYISNILTLSDTPRFVVYSEWSTSELVVKRAHVRVALVSVTHREVSHEGHKHKFVSHEGNADNIV